MSLRERLAEYQQPFQAVLAIATCRDSLGFADLWWPLFEFESELQRLIGGRDPGVIFETTTRVVVIEGYSGELRYYAGGWCPDQSRIYLEQERIETEGYELGIIQSPRDAELFAEMCLARVRALQDIEIPRLVRHRQETGESRRAKRCT